MAAGSRADGVRLSGGERGEGRSFLRGRKGGDVEEAQRGGGLLVEAFRDVGCQVKVALVWEDPSLKNFEV